MLEDAPADGAAALAAGAAFGARPRPFGAAGAATSASSALSASSGGGTGADLGLSAGLA